MLTDARDQVDVDELIDRSPVRGFQRLVFVLCFLVSLLDGFDIQTLAFAAAAIGREMHITPDRLGVVFSGTLLGAVAGAYLGVVADRIGRRGPILLAVALFGSMTLACAFTRDFGSLLLCRFLAGIGLGGAVPNMIALTSEFAPRRIRSTAVTVVLWGFPLGAMAGGVLSSWLISVAGWRSIFLVGAIGPMLLLPAMLWGLPESVRFLALRRPGHPRLARLLASLDPMLVVRPTSRVVALRDQTEGRSWRDLFRGGLATHSILLAGASMTSLLLSYLMTSWTPLLLQAGGLAPGAAILGGVAINAGSLIGSYSLARWPGAAPLARIGAAFLCGGLAVLALAASTSDRTATFLLLGAFGCFHVGAQIAVTNYVAAWYPTALRATGIAWVGAVGRLGSLAGPLLGGVLIAAGRGLPFVFAVSASAGLVTGGLLLTLAARGR